VQAASVLLMGAPENFTGGAQTFELFSYYFSLRYVNVAHNVWLNHHLLLKNYNNNTFADLFRAWVANLDLIQEWLAYSMFLASLDLISYD
jgi:hypothetical protein